jgi:hypothetical protein
MKLNISEAIDYRKAGLTWVEIGRIYQQSATKVRVAVINYLQLEQYGGYYGSQNN